jgi:RimJ/RimL family protein N-acetyltransferase
MIYGDRVRLRGIEEEDLEHYVSWLNDPEVRRGLAMVSPLSLADEKKWFEGIKELPPHEKPLAIEIQPDPDQDEWVFVGGCSFFAFQWQNHSAEIGIHIGEKKYWDQGFGTRVVKLLLRHGFSDLNLHRIWLRVFGDNPRAIRSYEKAGFIQEGKFREAQFLDGEYVDVMIMSVLRSEWQEN